MISLYWGDGQSSELALFDEIPIAENAYRVKYIGVHQYAAAGIYTLTYRSPNRQGGIANINPPNSDQIAFSIESKVTVFDTDLKNNAPILLEPPIDQGVVGQAFYHTPNAFDADGDSIVYTLIAPLQNTNTPVPNYTPIDAYLPNTFNQVHLDPFTGLLTWDAPQIPGVFSIAYKISAYRDDVLIDEIVRDMLIEVQEATNTSPVVQLSEIPNSIIPVSVGDMVVIEAMGNEPEMNQSIELTASSGLLTEVENPASFTASPPGNNVNGTFTWLVQENHARQAPYQIVFKVKDDYPEAGYAVFGILNYRVSSISSDQEADIRQAPILFPNPLRQGQIIRFKNWSGSMAYQLFTADGRLLESGILREPELDMGMLGTGLYLLVLEQAGQRFFYPFAHLD